jgi:hypothetical protein
MEHFMNDHVYRVANRRTPEGSGYVIVHERSGEEIPLASPYQPGHFTELATRYPESTKLVYDPGRGDSFDPDTLTWTLCVGDHPIIIRDCGRTVATLVSYTY